MIKFAELFRKDSVEAEKAPSYEVSENGKRITISVSTNENATNIMNAIYVRLEKKKELLKMAGNKEPEELQREKEENSGKLLEGKILYPNKGVFTINYNSHCKEIFVTLNTGEGEEYKKDMEEAVIEALGARQFEEVQ